MASTSFSGLLAAAGHHRIAAFFESSAEKVFVASQAVVQFGPGLVDRRTDVDRR